MLSRPYITGADLRKRQINTLKIFNDNVTEVTEGSEYHVVFTAGNNELTLIVFLGTKFPEEPPQIRITPIILHPWVTVDGQVTNAPGLLRYTIHSDLGRVVQAIIQEFIRNPPPLATEVHSGVTSNIRTTDMEPYGRASPISQNFINSATRIYNSPTRSSPPVVYFPELQNLSLDQLKMLDEFEPKQDEFLENLPQVKELNNTLETLISQIENIADNSLSKQEILMKKKLEVLDKLERVTALRSQCDALHYKYQTLADKYAPTNIQNLLEVAAENKDRECEAIARSFLNKEINVDTFLQSYIQARTSSQICKTKEEKLAHQLNELKRKGF